jgi:hypothetical protein
MWAENITMHLRERERGWEGVSWIDIAQDRDKRRALENTVLNLRVPKYAGKFLSGCTIGGFLRRAQLSV